MSQRAIVRLIVVALIGAGAYWVATNTYWTYEMRANPAYRPPADDMYAVKKLARSLGARAETIDRVSELPRVPAVAMLGYWDWELFPERRRVLERWVEAGGRLLVFPGQLWQSPSLTEWSGIAADETEVDSETQRCEPVRWRIADEVPRRFDADSYQFCGRRAYATLRSRDAPRWTAETKVGVIALRAAVGRGSVTVIDLQRFSNESLTNGDNALLLVAAAQLRPDDVLVELAETERPSIATLLWRYAGPAIAFLALAIVLIVWRASLRFGPLAPIPAPVRRSLASQLWGTGRFLATSGDGRSLHAASARALDEAAKQTLIGFHGIAQGDSVTGLATLGGIERDSLAFALDPAARRSPPRLRADLLLLERLRRLVLSLPRGTKLP